MILVIGDVMLDKYSFGEVSRISPEAPVPVIWVKKENDLLGGAGNVAKNISAMGEEVGLCGVVGSEPMGARVKELIQNSKITDLTVIDKNRSTTVKHRFIALEYNQQLLRADYENRTRVEFRGLKEKLMDVFNKNKVDVVVIADYAKGVVTEELMSYLKSKGVKILVDPKPNNIHMYKDVFLIKPNLKELSNILGETIKNEDKDVGEAAMELSKKLNTNIVVTRGGKGATLATTDGNVQHFPGHDVPVHDVTGAGDTFIATLAYGIKRAFSLEESIKLANKAASIVITKLGAATVTPEELGVE